MKLYKIFIRRYLTTSFFWFLPLIVLLTIGLAFFPTIIDNQENIQVFFNNYSKETLELLNINSNTFTTTLGFYAYIFPILTLFGAFGASHLGLQIMLDDRLNNIQVFLLVKPLSRKEILNTKKISAITILIIENIIFNIVSIILIFSLKINGGINLFQLLEINTSLFLLQLTFMFITMMIASFFKKPKSLLIKSLLIIILFFILSIIEHTYPNIALKYINPFSYFNVSDIITTGKYQYRFIVASLIIVFYSNTFSLTNYESEDIKW